MTTYKVLSDRLAGHEKGSTVTVKQLPGANIDALVAAGHLAEQPKETKTKKVEAE